MKDINFTKTKFNIAWASVLVIFVGSVLYVPAVYFADQKREVVYYKIPVVSAPVNQIRSTFPVSAIPGTVEMVDISTTDKNKIMIKIAEPIITKDLRMGDIDPEVKELQKYLNIKGFLVAEFGPGSMGQETDRFGLGTKNAVIRFQEAHKDILLKPFGLDSGTGIVGDLTRKLINS